MENLHRIAIQHGGKGSMAEHCLGDVSGKAAAVFSPDSVCTQRQIVPFLYRALAK